MAGLFDSYKSRLQSAYTGMKVLNPYTYAYVDERAPIQQELERDISRAKIDANLAGDRLRSTANSTSARAAFAAGRASKSRKRFKGRGGGLFGSIGKLDKANAEAAANLAKNATDLESLSDRAAAERAAASAKAQSYQPRFSIGAPITLW